jgi:hypothetical protein
VKSGKTAILGDVDSHWVRILLSFLSTFLDVAGPNILKLSYTNNTFLSPCKFASIGTTSITLKMEAVCSSHTLKYVTTAQHRNIKEHHYQVNNHHAKLTIINDGQNQRNRCKIIKKVNLTDVGTPT